MGKSFRLRPLHSYRSLSCFDDPSCHTAQKVSKIHQRFDIMNCKGKNTPFSTTASEKSQMQCWVPDWVSDKEPATIFVLIAHADK
jgi:hypothetical protein